jgi:hypothetical protein
VAHPNLAGKPCPKAQGRTGMRILPAGEGYNSAPPGIPSVLSISENFLRL